MYRIFGLSQQRDILTYKKFLRLVHPDDRAAIREASREALNGGNRSRINYRVVRPDGEVRFVHSQYEIERDASGRTIELIGTLQDVTELRMAEEELRRSEERFRALVQNSLDVVSVVDAEATILYYSPSVEAVMGYKPEEFLGKNALEASPIHPEDLPQVRDIFGYLVENPGVNYSMEMRMRHADGSWRIIEATANNLLDDPSVGGIVTNYRDITERKTFEKQLEHQAFHDTLTGLPNRTLLIDRLQHALSRIERHQTFIAVLFLDLDNFKVVNDSLGHQAGDELLVAVAKRLQECLRPADTLARLSGDEFVVLLEDISNESEVTRLTERLIRHLQAPFELEHQEEVHITASVGIAFGVSDNNGPDDLLRKADVAMYRAKSRGKAHYEVFNAHMDVDVRERLRLQTDLRQAIEREEFALQYQLEFDLVTGDVVGAEALIRWNHPERGVILPEEFITLAEETGLIVPVGRWVLQEACRQTLEWQKLCPQDPPLTIGVNLSARQFQLPSLAKEIADILQKTGLPPYSLVLEITESIMMESEARIMDELAELKALGLRLAIDDFGTGYSSLSYLKRFPVDFLKIDRAFVEGLGGDPEAEKVMAGIISLGQSLDLTTIAEGIETEEQLSRLKQLGCQFGQGHHLAQPSPAKAITSLLHQPPLRYG